MAKRKTKPKRKAKPRSKALKVVKPNQGGRPVTSKAKWSKFLLVLGNTANVRAAAGAAGIGTRTAYLHREHDAEFAELWEEAIADAMARIEARIFSAAVEGDSDAGKWLLARRLPGLYGKRVELEHRGAITTHRNVRVRFVKATKGRKDPDD